YVFIRSGTTWSQQAYIKASNTDDGDFFGNSVALSSDGSTLVVGATHEDSNATGVNGNQADNSATHRGAAYVFTRAGTAWSQQAYLKPSNGSALFGAEAKLSADGNTLLITGNDDSAATGINGNQADTSAPGSGVAYRFSRVGTSWSQDR